MSCLKKGLPTPEKDTRKPLVRTNAAPVKELVIEEPAEDTLNQFDMLDIDEPLPEEKYPDEPLSRKVRCLSSD